MTKHAKLCKAVESAYSGILLKEEQAAIVNAVLAELEEPDAIMESIMAEYLGLLPDEKYGHAQVVRLSLWHALLSYAGKPCSTP